VEALGYLLLLHLFRMQREHLLIARETLRPPLLLHAWAIRVAYSPEIGQRHGCTSPRVVQYCSAGLELDRLLGERLSRGLPRIDHLVQNLLQGGAQVLHQMEAVGHLDGISRSLCCAFGKRAGTVTRDDLHGRDMGQAKIRRAR
jgi:hypothetical protein